MIRQVMGIDRMGDRLETEEVLFGWALHGWTIEQVIRAIAATVELVAGIFLNNLAFSIPVGWQFTAFLLRLPSVGQQDDAADYQQTA